MIGLGILMIEKERAVQETKRETAQLSKQVKFVNGGDQQYLVFHGLQRIGNVCKEPDGWFFTKQSSALPSKIGFTSRNQATEELLKVSGL
jgi:hypothetical protein